MRSMTSDQQGVQKHSWNVALGYSVFTEMSQYMYMTNAGRRITAFLSLDSQMIQSFPERILCCK